MSTKTFAQFVQKDSNSIQTTDFLVGYRPIENDQATGEIRINVSDLRAYIASQITIPTVPTGTIMPYAGIIDATHPVPPGWILCDGSDYDRANAQYSALFAVINTTYGNKNNSTFKVPDLRGLFIRGFGGTSPNVSAQLGIVQTDEFEKHTHGITDPRHSHSYTITSGAGDTSDGLQRSAGTVSNAERGVNQNGSTTGSSGTGITIRDAGTSTETRPANLAMNYIIKL